MNDSLCILKILILLEEYISIIEQCFWPGVTIVHAHRAASYKSKKMLIIHIRNAIKYFNKWGWVFDSERKKWNKRLLKELL